MLENSASGRTSLTLSGTKVSAEMRRDLLRWCIFGELLDRKNRCRPVYRRGRQVRSTDVEIVGDSLLANADDDALNLRIARDQPCLAGRFLDRYYLWRFGHDTA